MSANASGIEIEGLVKDFRIRGMTLRALDSIDLTTKHGSFTAIVGPSGCGKSTLIRILASLEQPTSGRVQVDHKAPSILRNGHQIGVVFQDPALLPWRTVASNVRLPLELMGRSVRDSQVREMIALVGLQEYELARPSQLSGGMRQRVALARALVGEPRLLLLDEPFAALDDLSRIHLNVELMRVWSELRTTALLVTHSVREAVFLGDTVAVLSPRPGHVIQLVTVELERPRSARLLQAARFHELCDRITEHLLAQWAPIDGDL